MTLYYEHLNSLEMMQPQSPLDAWDFSGLLPFESEKRNRLDLPPSPLSQTNSPPRNFPLAAAGAESQWSE